jgi:transposase
MSNQRYSPEFKDEAVRQVVDRGYSVPEVADRLGVSSHSLYKWVKAVKPDNSEQQATALIEAKSEILKLRARLKRTEEERDILKKAARYFAREPEKSTASSMIIGMSIRSPECVGCCRHHAVAITNGCTSRCLIGPWMTNGCWA